jgi:biotin carboxyl carrier protein
VKYIVDTGRERFTVEIAESNDGLAVRVDGQPVELSIVSDQSNSKLLMLLNSRSYDTEVFRHNGRTSVFVLGRRFDCVVEDERLASIREVAGAAAVDHGAEIRAPMPGLVVRLVKQVGEPVKRGESVIIVEAMKMENELPAPEDGVIKDIAVTAGQAVDKGDLLITLE